MKMWILALVVCLSPNLLALDKRLVWTTQESIHPKIPSLLFYFYVDSSDTDEKSFNRISVVNQVTNKTVQVLSNFHASVPEQNFKLMDINFDGIKDLLVLDPIKNKQFYWVYDAETERFERLEALEDIAHPEFDFINKKVISVLQEPMGSRKFYYEFKNKKLVLVRQEMNTCDYSNQCETVVFVPQSELQNEGNLSDSKKGLAQLLESNEKTASLPQSSKDLQYLSSLANRKALCIAEVEEDLALGKHPETVNAQLKLSECYKGIIVDLAERFYPGRHFGEDLDAEISLAIDHHHRLLHKMAHCPSSKEGGCQYYEEFDVTASTVDYLSELIEFMVLNIGEGYAEFNPEVWLKKWDGVSAKA